MSEQKAPIRSRKYMLTFHNLDENGWAYEKIKEQLTSLKLDYYALTTEVGAKTQRKHIHLIIYRSTAIRANTLTKLFPAVHQDVLRGSMAEARAYLLKSEKWEGTDKAETSIAGTFEEWGELPQEKGRGKRSDLELMMELVQEQYSDLEIIQTVPSLVDRLTTIQRYRQLLIEEKAHEYRNMTVIYCYGKTGAGKTRGVYEQYNDPTTIYTINSYQGTGLFDGYDSSRIKVLCLDEFRSSLPFGLLLSLTDGQFQIINCRYANRIATHTTVWILSNISLTEQYPNVQQDEPESWRAFLRRITTVRHYYDIGNYHDYTVDEYLHVERYGLLDTWEKTAAEDTPFSPVAQLPESTDTNLRSHKETPTIQEQFPFGDQKGGE